MLLTPALAPLMLPKSSLNCCILWVPPSHVMVLHFWPSNRAAVQAVAQPEPP